MAEVIAVLELLGNRALVTRESARRLRPAITDSLARETGEVVLDFSGILGVTPSFVDELLQVIQDGLGESGLSELRVTAKNPPTRLSLKLVAIAKGRGAELRETEAGAWTVALRLLPASLHG